MHSALCDPYGLDDFWTARLFSLLRRLRAGGINPAPAITVVQETPCAALVDGDGGMGQLVSVRAMELCLGKVKKEGMALDVERFMAKDRFKARVDELVRQIKSAEGIPDVERIFLPGEMEQERKEARLKDGVPFWEDAREDLERICREFGVEPSIVFPTIFS